MLSKTKCILCFVFQSFLSITVVKHRYLYRFVYTSGIKTGSLLDQRLQICFSAVGDKVIRFELSSTCFCSSAEPRLVCRWLLNEKVTVEQTVSSWTNKLWD